MAQLARAVLAACILAVAVVQKPAAMTFDPAQTPAAAQFKGVFEPVNYPDDLSFEDVYFVSVDVGYVAGQAGTIIKTTDAGATWQVQLGGDRQSGATEVRNLRFVDEQHGWATQLAGGGRGTSAALLRTTDGETWEQIGQIEKNYNDLAFTSPANGVFLFNEKAFATTDGGRNWRQTAACQFKADVQGLSRTLDCEFFQLSFPSPEVGYALAGHASSPFVTAVYKTTDQGQTWSLVSTLPDEAPRDGEIFFINEMTGYMRVSRTKFMRTTDGGVTWTGIAGISFNDYSEIRFADPEVGWAIGFRWFGPTTSTNRTLIYTTTAGKLWYSRQIALPGGVRAFSLPRRDRGYLVGEHGMIYRFRVVPATETVPKSIAAPLSPVYDTPLDDHLAKAETQLLALEKTAQQSTPAAATALTQQIAAVEATVTAASAEAPKFVTKYKNLNLLLVGAQMSGEFLTQVQGLKDSVVALKQSKGNPGAMGASITDIHQRSVTLAEMIRGFMQKKKG